MSFAIIIVGHKPLELASAHIMTDIRNSIEKLRAASKLLENADYSDPNDQEKIQNLRDALSELNENMEELKMGVNQSTNSPIRFNK